MIAHHYRGSSEYEPAGKKNKASDQSWLVVIPSAVVLSR